MLFHRQKILLSLLESLGGAQSATDFQKYLFLYTTTCEKEKSYDFVPYKYGCYSFQAYADKIKLINKGYLKDSENWELANFDISYAHTLSKNEPKKLGLFSDRYISLKGNELLQHVYKNYPYYATRSIISEKILTPSEIVELEKYKPKKKRKPVMATIGYEGGSIETYLNRLIQADIRLLIDVRKNPISRKYGFSKNTLSKLLSKIGVDYIHIPELGIQSVDRKNLNTQKDYEKLFLSYESTVLNTEVKSLELVFNLYKEKRRVALTCFEKDHHQCHRSRIAERLAQEKPELELIHL